MHVVMSPLLASRPPGLPRLGSHWVPTLRHAVLKRFKNSFTEKLDNSTNSNLIEGGSHQAPPFRCSSHEIGMVALDRSSRWQSVATKLAVVKGLPMVRWPDIARAGSTLRRCSLDMVAKARSLLFEERIGGWALSGSGLGC